MADKKSFIMYIDNKKQFDMLTDEQAGILIKAIFSYAETGIVPDIPDGMANMAFMFIADTMKRDAEKYEAICKRNSENGKKGGRPKKEGKSKTQKKRPVFLGYLEKPKKADNDSDSVSDSESDSESDNEIDSVCDSVNVAAPEKVATQTHTHQKTIPEISEIIAMAKNLGYQWDCKEAEKFLAYNLDKGRTENWGYALRVWEENRIKRMNSGKRSKYDKPMTEREIEEMNAYLALSNRYPKKGG